ncbi:unnamed protein product [Amoebophrya sp. A25]|nr:unnamed protein product [Amoebophrya sp. A25]|eukprot:GSA25T00003804001.1
MCDWELFRFLYSKTIIGTNPWKEDFWLQVLNWKNTNSQGAFILHFMLNADRDFAREVLFSETARDGSSGFPLKNLISAETRKAKIYNGPTYSPGPCSGCAYCDRRVQMLKRKHKEKYLTFKMLEDALLRSVDEGNDHANLLISADYHDKGSIGGKRNSNSSKQKMPQLTFKPFRYYKCELVRSSNGTLGYPLR